MSHPKINADIARLNGAYKRTFDTPDGQIVLDHLVTTFAQRSSIVPGDPYATHAREGGREVVLLIQSKIRSAKHVVDE